VVAVAIAGVGAPHADLRVPAARAGGSTTSSRTGSPRSRDRRRAPTRSARRTRRGRAPGTQARRSAVAFGVRRADVSNEPAFL